MFVYFVFTQNANSSFLQCDLMNGAINVSMVFICLGRQTKQIMVAKFQTLMFLFANAESSQNSSKRFLPFLCTLTLKY
jgi:hypothetical protein